MKIWLLHFRPRINNVKLEKNAVEYKFNNDRKPGKSKTLYRRNHT